MNDDRIKLRLLRDHYLNGRKRRAGTVVRLRKAAAKWLTNAGRATKVR